MVIFNSYLYVYQRVSSFCMGFSHVGYHHSIHHFGLPTFALEKPGRLFRTTQVSSVPSSVRSPAQWVHCEPIAKSKRRSKRICYAFSMRGEGMDEMMKSVVGTVGSEINRSPEFKRGFTRWFASETPERSYEQLPPQKKDFAQLCTYDFGMFFWSPWFFGSTNHPGEGHNFWGKCHFPPSPGVPSCWFGWPPGISLRISTAGCKTSSASRASSTCGWTRRTSRSSAGCLNGCWCWCTRRCINPRWTSGWLVGWGRLVLGVLVWCWGWMWRGLLVVVSFFGQGPKGMEKMLQSGDFWWGKPMIQSKIDWRKFFRLKERWDNIKMTICWGDGSWPERNVDIFRI